MIPDNHINTIYFSESLIFDSRFVNTCKQLFPCLHYFGVTYKFLPKTNDIWARDFMPIQVNETKYVEYRYDPDYLQSDWKGFRDTKTYPDIVCDALNLKTEKSDLILDGVNMVKSSGCIILTEKAGSKGEPTNPTGALQNTSLNHCHHHLLLHTFFMIFVDRNPKADSPGF